MIYTVTFNPSLDYIINLDKFNLGAVNRAQQTKILAGGKGVNVTIVLHNLGIESIALGFIAGFTGYEIEQQTTALGCTTDFIHLPIGTSRINVKLKADYESEINGLGPSIGTSSLNDFFAKIDNIQQNDWLVLAGSIPNTLPNNIYEQIMQRIHVKNINVVVDATGELLVKVLKYKPFLIKPNNYELEEIFNTKLKSTAEIIDCAYQLQNKGAQNILVSLAGKGAIFLAADGTVYQRPAPKGIVKNSVGAGDSMVAGFIAGFLTTNHLEDAFKMSIATGSASAFSDELATKAEVTKLLEKI